MQDQNTAWSTTMMEVDGRLELMVVFSKADAPAVVMRFSELQRVVANVQDHMGGQGYINLLHDDLQVWN